MNCPYHPCQCLQCRADRGAKRPWLKMPDWPTPPSEMIRLLDATDWRDSLAETTLSVNSTLDDLIDAARMANRGRQP